MYHSPRTIINCAEKTLRLAAVVSDKKQTCLIVGEPLHGTWAFDLSARKLPIQSQDLDKTVCIGRFKFSDVHTHHTRVYQLRAPLVASQAHQVSLPQNRIEPRYNRHDSGVGSMPCPAALGESLLPTTQLCQYEISSFFHPFIEIIFDLKEGRPIVYAMLFQSSRHTNQTGSSDIINITAVFYDTSISENLVI